MSTSKLIDGKAAAHRVLTQVKADVQRLKTDGIEPALAVILVGQDPASQVYVRNKILRAEEAGIRSLEYRLNADTTQAQLLKLIAGLNDDDSVNAVAAAHAHRRNPSVAGYRSGQRCRRFSQ